ncbi:MAG: aspartate aminotransferase [Spirochaetales bacterium]|nr:aspartate aminotransferase [Spirochaetales bacterium]
MHTDPEAPNIQNVPIARSLESVEPSRIRELANIVFAMEDVLQLHFGESNMPTPRYIRDAAVAALDEGYLFYTENAGLPGLRAAIADKYSEIHDVTIDPRFEIVVTASGVQALNVAIRCVIDPGDEAIILSPNWPNAKAIVNMYGGRAVEVPFLTMSEGFEIDFEALETAISPRTRLLAYTSPSNPLGWAATLDDQRRLLEYCRRHRLWLLADEVYERIYYKGSAAPSILRLCTRDDAVIVAQSFSKTYCMTGWRLGWIVSRGDLAHKAAQLNEFIVSHAAAMVQRAGEIALGGDDQEIIDMAEVLHKRVEYCYKAIEELNLVRVAKPAGAFYLFPRIEGITDSFAFAKALLEKAQVSVAPGIAFGKGGEGSVRLCCASDFSVLEPAMERIRAFIEGESYLE